MHFRFLLFSIGETCENNAEVLLFQLANDRHAEQQGRVLLENRK